MSTQGNSGRAPMRRADDQRATHDTELLMTARKYEEHEAWCPECRESAWKMCSEGMDLMQAVYMCLRSSKF